MWVSAVVRGAVTGVGRALATSGCHDGVLPPHPAPRISTGQVRVAGLLSDVDLHYRVTPVDPDDATLAHVWLTADVPYTAAHHYHPERAAYQDFDPHCEFVSGPLNAGGFGPNALDGTFGPEAVFVAAPPRASVSPLEGFQYFGQVDIDPDTEHLTAALKDIDRKSLFTQGPGPRREVTRSSSLGCT